MILGSETDDEVESGFAGFGGMVTCYDAHIDTHEWIVDSGASDYMYGNRKLIKNFLDIDHTVENNLPNGKTSKIEACGYVELKCRLNLKEVLIVPDFKHNLLSANKLA